MIEIRPYQDGWRAGVAALIVPIQQREFGLPITLDAQPDLADIPGFYQQGKGQFWVALAGGGVVGSIGLLDIGDGQGALRKMFVAEAYRGAAHGVAPRLLGTLLDWCAGYGVHELYLGTTEQFLAAHRFYEKHGFTVLPREALPAAFPVMAVDNRFYWRKVEAAAAHEAPAAARHV